MSRHPSVKWAQTSDVVFITIELPDAKGIKLNLEPEGKFYFSATSGADNTPYEVDLDLYDKVNVNESKTSVTSRSVYYLVMKEESKWWSRLLKTEGKPPVFVKVDWDKWVDEDEQDEQAPGADMGLGDFDFSNLNMGGPQPEEFGVGDEEDDEDDDDSDIEEEVKEEAAEFASSEAKAAPTSNDPQVDLHSVELQSKA